MNWICISAGLASATILGAHAMQPVQQPQDAPRQQLPARAQQPVEHPSERTGEWSEQEVTRPGEHHQVLEPVIGEWTALITAYRNGQQMESRGVLRAEWTLQNRFIRGTFTGDEDGEDREGISFLGYNNAADRYETVWMDTSSTEIMRAVGHLEPTTQVLTLHGQYTCTMTGAKIPTRIVARMDTPDRIIWEMFENPSEEREHKTLEIVYTRRGPGQQAPAVR